MYRSTVVTRPALELMRQQHCTRSDAARALGVHYTTVARAEARYGITLARRPHLGRSKPYTNQQVLDCAAAGLSMRETAVALGTTYVAIRQHAIKYNVFFTNWNHHKPKKALTSR